jgi:23S rRNA (uridine2552-2'-O)-methyltransferase
LTKEWIRQRKRDPFYRKAKTEGFRSRASYKVKQMNDRVSFLKKGYKVLDLGAAPGGWSQYAVSEVGNGNIVAVDIQMMDPIEGVHFIQGDIEDPGVMDKVREIFPEYNVVLSDISPSLSGNRTLDRGRALALSWSVMKFSIDVLKKNGTAVVKMFMGDEVQELKDEYGKYFWKVENHKPPSSLKRSFEIYLIFRGFKGWQED